MFAAFNGTALLGALTGPIAFGMMADFVGLRWALAATTVAPLMWMPSLVIGVRSEARAPRTPRKVEGGRSLPG